MKKNLTLSDGAVFICLCVRLTLGHFYESMYIHVYGGQWSPWRVSFDIFMKVSILKPSLWDAAVSDVRPRLPFTFGNT